MRLRGVGEFDLRTTLAPMCGTTTNRPLVIACVRMALRGSSFETFLRLSLHSYYSEVECTKIVRFSAVAAAICTAPLRNCAIFKASRCAISLRSKTLANSDSLRKILAPIKIKSAPPPQTQNTPPPKGGILWIWFVLQKECIFSRRP